MLQSDALPPPIGWDEQPDLVDVEVDQQADVSDTELEDTDDLAVVPPPPTLPDDTFPEDAGIPERRELSRSERTRGPQIGIRLKLCPTDREVDQNRCKV